jgi:hypothetical protein
MNRWLDLRIVLNLSLNFQLAFEVRKRPTLNAYQSCFLLRADNAVISRSLDSSSWAPMVAEEAPDAIGRRIVHVM